MGKSKRKKKLKEEDFKKKKLKVGKRLPMPDNVTKTSFKARSINILQNQDGGRELFADDGKETTFKRQNLKDLLSSCSHYNTQAREDALFGLKDLMEKHPVALKENINEIFQKSLGKITDIEFSVRRAFLSFISFVFKHLTSDEIAPFFPNVTAYLCSAMTHLNDGVRLDSMKFLDLCLDFYPKLLSAHSTNVIQNFLDVISSESDCHGTSKKVSRGTLKAKVTSQKTQLQVLTRLNKLLRVMGEVHHSGSGGALSRDEGRSVAQGHNWACGTGARSDSGGMVNGSGLSSKGRFSGHVDSCLGNDNNSGGIVSGGNAAVGWFGNSTIGGNNDGTSNGVVIPKVRDIHVSNFLLHSTCLTTSTKDALSTDLLGSKTRLQEFISRISPLLFEYWIECCPAEFVMNLIPVIKTSISLQIMQEVLEIFTTLLDNLEKIISDQDVFRAFIRNNLLGQFTTHFMAVFPLSFTIQEDGPRKKKEAVVESICDVTLNLLMSELLCYVIPEESTQILSKWLTSIFQYLNKVLLDKSKGTNSQAKLQDVKKLTKLVKVLLFSLPLAYNDLKVKLLQNMLELFEASHAMSNVKKVLLNFLQDILRNFTIHQVSPKLKTTIDIWLSLLVKLVSNKDLAQSTVHNIFTILKAAILQDFPNTRTAVTSTLFNIFKPKIFLNFGEETKKLVIEMVYHLNQVPSKQFYEVLSSLCNSQELSSQTFAYVVEVAYHLANPETPNQVSASEVSNYLSFVLSVTTGMSQAELKKLQMDCKYLEHFSHPVNKEYILVIDSKCLVQDNVEQDSESFKDDWDYQKSIIGIICKYLSLTEYSAKLVDILACPLEKLFDQFTSLPLTVVYRLLFMANALLTLAESSETQTNDQSKFVRFQSHLGTWCAVLWCFLSLKTGSAKTMSFQIIVNDIKTLIKETLKLSATAVQSLFKFIQESTLSTLDDANLSCRVITDILKSGQQDLVKDYQTYFVSIQKNLGVAFNAGKIERQTYSDFEYQCSLF